MSAAVAADNEVEIERKTAVLDEVPGDGMRRYGRDQHNRKAANLQAAAAKKRAAMAAPTAKHEAQITNH